MHVALTSAKMVEACGNPNGGDQTNSGTMAAARSREAQTGSDKLRALENSVMNLSQKLASFMSNSRDTNYQSSGNLNTPRNTGRGLLGGNK